MPPENEDISDLKLEIVRTELRTGFSEVKAAIIALAASVEKESLRVSALESRIRALELEGAANATKLKIFGLVMTLSSGGAGALISKLF